MSENKKAVYSVNLWGSHPEAGNDDCWTGEDFAALGVAVEAARDWRSHFGYDNSDVAYVEIDGVDENGVGFYQLTKNEKHRPSRRSDDGEWARERAMQAGMAFGCDGYNDEMGF